MQELAVEVSLAIHQIRICDPVAARPWSLGLFSVVTASARVVAHVLELCPGTLHFWGLARCASTPVTMALSSNVLQTIRYRRFGRCYC
jgi:hypothetical protein